MIDMWKVMFTFMAFVFDLYKWGIFIVATSQSGNYKANEFY
jgi:hypothetical protein